jgi:hypothetical protein
MTTNSRPIPAVDHQSNLTELAPLSPAGGIDVFETRRLPKQCERIAKKTKIDRPRQEAAVLRERSLDLADNCDHGLYWLIWAVLLAALVLGIFGS